MCIGAYIRLISLFTVLPVHIPLLINIETVQATIRGAQSDHAFHFFWIKSPISVCIGTNYTDVCITLVGSWPRHRAMLKSPVNYFIPWYLDAWFVLRNRYILRP